MDFGTAKLTSCEKTEKMTKIPHTYAEWISILDELKTKTNDSEVLVCMKNGTLEWQVHVADRFIKKLIDVVKFRIDRAIDKFAKEQRASNGNESQIIQSLLSLRKELIFLLQVVDINAIPNEDRKKLKEIIVENANSIQKSLEDSAKDDRSGKMSSIVKNNRVNLI